MATIQTPVNPATTPAVVDPNANTANNPNANLTNEREDVSLGYDVKDGKQSEEESVYAVNDKLEERIKAGTFVEVLRVTTSLSLPKTFEGLIDFYKTPEEQAEGLKNHNRGVTQKVINRRNALLSSFLVKDDDGKVTLDEEAVEKALSNGVIDMTPEVASPSKRMSLTEEEKLDRFLATLPENLRASMKAAYLAARQ